MFYSWQTQSCFPPVRCTVQVYILSHSFWFTSSGWDFVVWCVTWKSQVQLSLQKPRMVRVCRAHRLVTADACQGWVVCAKPLLQLRSVTAGYMLAGAGMTCSLSNRSTAWLQECVLGARTQVISKSCLFKLLVKASGEGCSMTSLLLVFRYCHSEFP